MLLFDFIPEPKFDFNQPTPKHTNFVLYHATAPVFMPQATDRTTQFLHTIFNAAMRPSTLDNSVST